MEVSDGVKQKKSGTIKYTGEGPAPEDIEYKIQANGGGAEGTAPVIDGTVDVGRSICEGCAIVQKDEEIDVEIIWDGQTENFTITFDK